jgi:serine/threonine-protein kinase
MEELSTARVSVHVGDLLAGQFRVERLLGAGGMGLVVAAVHVPSGGRVALKLLLPEQADRPEIVARFLREARAASRIESDHVARVSSVGTLGTGEPYMVMELLTGSDLQKVLAARGPLPVQVAAEYLLQACEAVAEAHARGLVHRDLKPSNLFLTTRADGSPLVKVLDFGISKATGEEAPLDSLTTTTAVLGSPHYMSPEQIRSARSVDRRTDVWSLGVVLYHLVTGAFPHEGETVSGLLAAIVADRAVPLRARNPELPESLERLVMGCLHKDPARRVGSVARFAAALAPFAPPEARASAERAARTLASEPAAAPDLAGTPAGDSLATAPQTVVRVPDSSSSARGRLRPSRGLALGVAGGLLVAGLGAIITVRPWTGHAADGAGGSPPAGLAVGADLSSEAGAGAGASLVPPPDAGPPPPKVGVPVGPSRSRPTPSMSAPAPPRPTSVLDTR